MNTFSGFRSRWTTPFMGGGQATGDLEGVVHRLLLGDWPGVELSAQGLAFQELHDGECDFALRPEIEDGQDVGVGKGRDRLRLALKARQHVGIARERRRKNLDCDVSVELAVPRPVHLAHPTCTELRNDLVGAEAGTGRERHEDLAATLHRGSWERRRWKSVKTLKSARHGDRSGWSVPPPPIRPRRRHRP